jgi:hypothetical protein
VEALARQGRGAAQRLGQRGQDLSLGRGERRTEPELGGGSAEPGQQQRLGLGQGEPGQAGAVAAQEAAAAARPAHPVDRDPGSAEGLEVAVDGAHRDAELRRQLGRRDRIAAALEQEQQGEQPRRAHPGHNLAYS